MSGEKLEKRFGWWPYIIAAVVWGMLMFAYGRWQYHRGFDTGADTAICAFAISIEGAKPAMNYDACKNITDRDYEIDGFDNGAGKAENRS